MFKKDITKQNEKWSIRFIFNFQFSVLRFIALCVILHSPFSILHSQTAYPVQAVTNLLPPYSLYLTDYASGARERISITLINRDNLRPGLQVRLKLTIKGPGFTIQTLPQAVFLPITIDPGIPYRLSKEEIAPYFDPAALNIQGLGTQSYRSEGRLPEGMLQFCFEVFEYHTGNLVSQPGCGTAWVTVQKPPQLSLPFNNETVTARNPLNLLFQWTPRHSGLQGVEYEVIVKQLWDNGMKPEAAFAYSTEIIRERVKPTSFLYGAMMPPLTPGYRYAWAIRAVATDGFTEQRVFENDGLSEIRTFTLAEHCPEPIDVKATTERGAVNIQWTPQPAHIDFSIAYREASGALSLADNAFSAPGSENANGWKYLRTITPQAKLYEVAPGKTYEYRLGASCTPGNPVYGAIRTIAIPLRDTAYLANCGTATEIDLTNRELLPGMVAGEEFRVGGDFPIHVTSVTGGNGVFSGTGYSLMPGMFNFAKVAVRWDNITINTDRRMISGKVQTIADPNEGQLANLDDIFEGGALHGKIKDGITKTEFTVDFAIDSLTLFTIENGTLTIENGQEHVAFTLPQNESQSDGYKDTSFPSGFEPVTVTDKDGNLYKVAQSEEDPTKLIATQIGKSGDALTVTSFNAANIDKAKAVVTFRKGKGYYAFDTWQDYYSQAYLIRDKYHKLDGDYQVSWKLLPPGKADEVEASIEIKDGKIDPARVIFKTREGTTFNSIYKDGVYTISLIGGEAGDGQELFACYKSEAQYLNFGKLNIATYAEQTYKVVVVPVYETPVDIDAIRRTLKDVYGPVGINWQVSEEKNYHYNGENKFFDHKSGLLNSYTPEMRAMNADFSSRFSVDPKTNYLFVLQYSGNEHMERDAAGFMPRGGQFGYIFTRDFKSDNEVLQTIAHELGHGKLLLKHTFDKDYGIRQGITDNLMDYVPGKTHLAKWQWDVLSDPGIAQGVFDRDEDGMKTTQDIVLAQMQWMDVPTVKQAGIYLTPAGKPIWLSGLKKVQVMNHTQTAASSITFTTQAVVGFELEDGKRYFSDLDQDNFKGYYLTGEKGQTNYYSGKTTGEKIGKSYTLYLITDSKITEQKNVSKWWYQPSNWDSYKGEGSLTMQIPDCDCADIKEQYTGSSLMDHVLSTAIDKDPCILHTLEPFNNSQIIFTSPWMKDFNLAFGVLANVALAPAIIEAAVVPVLDVIVPLAIEEGSTLVAWMTRDKAANITAGVTMDICLQALIMKHFMDVPDDRILENIDYVQAAFTGGEAALNSAVFSTFISPIYSSLFLNGKLRENLSFDALYDTYLKTSGTTLLVQIFIQKTVSVAIVCRKNIVQLRKLYLADKPLFRKNLQEILPDAADVNKVCRYLDEVDGTTGLAKGTSTGEIFGRNFAEKLRSNTSLNSVEKAIAEEAHEILNSAEFGKIRSAYSMKAPVQIEINGRTISYDDAPFSGMTWFEKDGFNIGREAFKDKEELIKTILHEMHRLKTSTLRGRGIASEVAKETKAAFDYAEKSYYLFE